MAGERILREPQWAAAELHRNPQWINEELRRQEAGARSVRRSAEGRLDALRRARCPGLIPVAREHDRGPVRDRDSPGREGFVARALAEVSRGHVARALPAKPLRGFDPARGSDRAAFFKERTHDRNSSNPPEQAAPDREPPVRVPEPVLRRQGALQNARRAGATCVDLTYVASAKRLAVRDDGCGIA